MGLSQTETCGPGDHRTSVSPQPEFACGLCAPGDPCACRKGRGQLTARALHLATKGLELAQRGNLAAAELLLVEALTIDPAFTQALATRGLCALARGDIRAARACWQTAVAYEPTSAACEWLESLQAGELKSMVEHYNEALSLTKGGDAAAALRSLAKAESHCPEFQPVIDLQGLLRRQIEEAAERHVDRDEQSRGGTVVSGQGPLPAERSHPDQGRAHRWVVQVTAAAVLVAVGWWAGWRTSSRPRTGSEALANTASIAAPPAVGVAAESATVNHDARRAVATAPDNSPDSLAALLKRTGVDSAHEAGRVLEHTTRAQYTSGRHRYLEGRAAFKQRQDRLAIRRLREAVRDAAGAYYEDDALYLLMLAEARVGDRSSAGVTARRLLQLHSTSIYANSRTRRLASPASPLTGR